MALQYVRHSAHSKTFDTRDGDARWVCPTCVRELECIEGQDMRDISTCCVCACLACDWCLRSTGNYVQGKIEWMCRSCWEAD